MSQMWPEVRNWILERHLTSSKGQKCEDCGFKSCTHIGFVNHMKKAHGKKLEQSNLKDSNLRNPNEEVSKREKASISKPYNCTKCDYKTHSKLNLNVHMKSKDEPTVC